MSGRGEWDDERSRRNERNDGRWYESAPSDQWGDHYDAQYDEAEDPGVTLVPQTPGQWAIALAVLALLVGGLGGVYWNSVSRQAAADEAISAAMARLTAASQSDNTPQSLGAALRDEMPMSGRYPVGPDGKLQRPKDAPTPEVPRFPDNAQYETPEGADAFNKYFIDLIPYTWVTADTSKVEKASHPDCIWCNGLITYTKKIEAGGGWVEEASVKINSASDPILVTPDEKIWRSEYVITFGPLHPYSVDGEFYSQEADTETLVFLTQFTDQGWRVYQIAPKEKLS